LEKIICKIYEDSILGKLPEARYAALDEQYAKEQNALSKEIADIEAALGKHDQSRRSADKFIALVEKYENFGTLSTLMINEFVEKIHVHERDRKGSIETTQDVEIFFNFIGRYKPPHFGEVNLTPEEQEEIRKREERKDRLHQNYLRRKAAGKVA
jgi:EAL domain-containing protein (putative c-di-GMP-specific phosphodiesterase class I)